MTKFSKNCEIIITSSPKESSVAYPDLELKGRRCFFVACPTGFSSFCDSSSFFTQKKKGGLGPPGPSPNSATDLLFEFEF